MFCPKCGKIMIPETVDIYDGLVVTEWRCPKCGLRITTRRHTLERRLSYVCKVPYRVAP